MIHCFTGVYFCTVIYDKKAFCAQCDYFPLQFQVWPLEKSFYRRLFFVSWSIEITVFVPHFFSSNTMCGHWKESASWRSGVTVSSSYNTYSRSTELQKSRMTTQAQQLKDDTFRREPTWGGGENKKHCSDGPVKWAIKRPGWTLTVALIAPPFLRYDVAE